MTVITRFSRFHRHARDAAVRGRRLGFWFAPEETAAQMGLEAASASSLMVARADLGGLHLRNGLRVRASAIRTGRRAWFNGGRVRLWAAIRDGTNRADGIMRWSVPNDYTRHGRGKKKKEK
jgi:hypothetical protein